MNRLLLALVITTASSLAQIATFPGSGGSGGVGAANPSTTVSGSSTTQTVDVSSLGLTSLGPAILTCKTATATVPFTFSTVGSSSLTGVVFTYASTSGVTCTVNSNGGAGANGQTGQPGPGYAATSTSTNTIGTGSITFATQSGLAYSVGARARAASASAPANYIEGLVTSYSGTSLVINSDLTGGSGSFSSWNINIAGVQGATGTAALPTATAANQALVATGAGTNYAPTPLAVVATSGAYPDLAGKPTIPTVSGSGILKASGGNAVPAAAADVTGLFTGCSGTLVLAANGTCVAQSSGATVSGTSILKGASGNAVPAASSDVTGLFSGCTGSLLLGADGACHAAGTGTVTGASVSNANGFTGTVTNPSTSPAIAIGTTITGPIKGTGFAITSAAASDITGLYSGCSGSMLLGADGICHTAGTGSVTTASVASANGLAGTVANASTAPVITLQTTVTGITKGNGTGLSPAASSDVTGLFTGCSGSLVLSANGTCVAPGGIAASTAVTDTATPTYTVLANTTTQGFTVDLSPGIPITGGTLVGTNATDGEQISLSFGPQPSTPVSVAFPANLIGAGAVDQTVGATTTVTCKWNAVTSTAKFCGATTSDASTPKLITTTGHTITFPDVNATAMTTVTSVLPAQLPALAGDLSSTSGSAAPTVVKVNGGAVPASQPCVGTNSGGQLVGGTCPSGSGITTLTSDVSATGTGSAAATVNALKGGTFLPPNSTVTDRLISMNALSGLTNAIQLYPNGDPNFVEPATAVAAAPAGSTFVFNPGLYRLAAVINPLSNDNFIGVAGGTGNSGPIIRGSKVLTGGVSASNGNYYYTGQTQGEMPLAGSCNGAFPMCQHSNDTFYNGAVLGRAVDCVGGPSGALGSTAWCFDQTNHRIYVGFNAATGLLETDVLNFAIAPSASGVNGVTIKNLTFQQFASNYQTSALGGYNPGQNWTLDTVSVSGSHGRGASILSGGKAINSFFNSNGNMGLGGAGTGILDQNNQHNGNNYAGYDSGNECGGSKYSLVHKLHVLGGQFNGNLLCDGLWFDIDSADNVVEGASMDNNTGDGTGNGNGIHYEISKGLVLRYNHIGGNTGAAVTINNSSRGEIYQNQIVVPGTSAGVYIIDQLRDPDDNGISRSSRGNYIHDNVTTMLAGNTGLAATVYADHATGTHFVTPVQNHFDYNSYQVSDASANLWGSTNFAAWQASGQDIHGGIGSNLSGNAMPLTAPSVLALAQHPTLGNTGQGIVTLDLDASDINEITPTGPITYLSVSNAYGHSPFVIRICNPATPSVPYKVLPALNFYGFRDNTTTAPGTCSSQSFSTDASGNNYRANEGASQGFPYFSADNFNGPFGTNLVGTSLLVGGTWLQGDAAGGGTNYYTGNGGVTNNSNYNSAYISTVPTQANYTVQADLIYPNTPNGNEESALVVRSTNNSGAGYFCQYRLSSFSINTGYGGGTTGTAVPVTLGLGVPYQMSCSVKTNTTTAANADLTLTVIRKTDGYYLTSSGTWQAAPAVAVTAANDSSGWTASGSVGFVMSKGTAQPQFNNFVVTLN